MKTLFEQMGGTYRQVGDYRIPNLALPAKKEMQPIGKYGIMHHNYIKKHKHVFYINLLTSGKLNAYLHEIDEQAQRRIKQIVEALANADGTDETLKAHDQMKWVQLMNNYRHAAEEIVFQEVVFA